MRNITIKIQGKGVHILKISVIIPVYNISEDYLRECLSSVTAQTYIDAEFIVVIDGATDHSSAICEEYSALDSRFKLYRKPHSGAGAARNFGMDKAVGDYVMFIDSDDYWLDTGLLDEIAKLLDESCADILSFSYIEFYKEAGKPVAPTRDNLPRERVVNNPGAINCLLKAPRSTFSSSVITKAVNLSFIRDNGIRFLEDINGEDTHFTAQLIYYAKSYDRLNRHVYAVRRHRQSTSRSAAANERVLSSMLIVFDDLLKRFDLSETSRSPVLDFLASPYLYMLGKAVALENADIYIRQLRKYAFVLGHSSRFYVRLVGVVAHNVGFNLTLTMLHFFLLINHRLPVSIGSLEKERS